MASNVEYVSKLWSFKDREVEGECADGNSAFNNIDILMKLCFDSLRYFVFVLTIRN